MANISNIIIHCSDSSFGSASLIRSWHLQNGWSDIGYHFVVLNGFVSPGGPNGSPLTLPLLDGMVEVGRRLDGDNLLLGLEIGAHALGYNDRSVGICLIGRDRFSEAQFRNSAALIRHLAMLWKVPAKNILGHYQVTGNRTCPNFDVPEFKQKYHIV